MPRAHRCRVAASLLESIDFIAMYLFLPCSRASTTLSPTYYLGCMLFCREFNFGDSHADFVYTMRLMCDFSRGMSAADMLHEGAISGLFNRRRSAAFIYTKMIRFDTMPDSYLLPHIEVY